MMIYNTGAVFPITDDTTTIEKRDPKQPCKNNRVQTVLNLSYVSYINNKTKQPSMQKGMNWRLNKHTDIMNGTFTESNMH